MSKLAHSDENTMRLLDVRRAIDEGNEDCVGLYRVRKQCCEHPGLTFYRITSADFDSVQREVENLIDGKACAAKFSLPIREGSQFCARGVVMVSA